MTETDVSTLLDPAHWSDLVSAALVGTDRRTLGGDAATGLL